MPIIGIFYVPDATPAAVQSLIARLQERAQAQLPRWSLTHHLLRATKSGPDDAAPPAFQHLLKLTYAPHQGRTYVASSSGGEAAVPPNGGGGGGGGGVSTVGPVVAIPAHQNDAFLQLLLGKLGALWAPRAAVQVPVGIGYDLGDFTVRLGELKAVGAQAVSRGFVVCIAAVGEIGQGDEEPPAVMDEAAVADAQELVREVWSGLGVEGAREAITRDPGDADGEVKLWCEVLRLRG